MFSSLSCILLLVVSFHLHEAAFFMPFFSNRFSYGEKQHLKSKSVKNKEGLIFSNPPLK